MNMALKKHQVYKKLRDLIFSGQWAPGEKLAGEIELAKQLAISRVTLRDALELLVEEKLLVRLPSRGTFVAEDVGGGNYMAIAGAFDDDTSPSGYILPGLEKRLAQAGRKLRLCSQQFIQSLAIDEARAIFAENRIDGVFLLEDNFTGDEKELRILENCGLPVIAPHGTPRDREKFSFPLMLSDIRQAFADGLRYLAGLGHARVGTLWMEKPASGREGAMVTNRRGFSAAEYLDFLHYNGLSTHASLRKSVPYDAAAIKRAVREMVFGACAPTAIVCFSDFYAIHACAALKEMDIHIPEQISVMGFCGYPGGDMLRPALSTVDLQYEGIGRRAAELMLRSSEWFGDDKNPLTQYTPYRVAVRESTMAPVCCPAPVEQLIG